jgi:hypothetical protein
VRPILFIANPSSAMGRSRSLLERAVAWFNQNGIATHQLISQHAGHLFEALPPLLKEDWQTIIVLGGDGTLFEVVNICLESTSDNFATPLALIPAAPAIVSERFGRQCIGRFLRKVTHGMPQPVDVARCRFNNGVKIGRNWHKMNFTSSTCSAPASRRK